MRWLLACARYPAGGPAVSRADTQASVWWCKTPDNHFMPSRLRGVLQRSTGFCEGVLALSSSCALPRLMRKGLEKEAGFGSGQLLMKRGEVMAQVWPN